MVIQKEKKKKAIAQSETIIAVLMMIPTFSNNVNTLIVCEGLQCEQCTKALMQWHLARGVAEVSLKGLVSLCIGLGDGNVLEGHCEL